MDLKINRTPEAVRAWWTDLPEDYTAEDAAEQPFRIVTLEKRPDGRELETHWKTPMGTMKVHESLRVQADDAWRFDIEKSIFGLGARDDFRTERTPEGTRLHIRSEFIPRSAWHRVLGPVLVPLAKRIFHGNFTTAARLCERDAPDVAAK